MLDFAIIFFMFVLGSCGISWVMYMAIQEGELFGRWQNVLEKLYSSNHLLLEKFLGGCFKCFSHLWALFTFGLYVLFYELFMETGFGWWYILLYILYVPTAILLSNLMFFTIEKLAEKPKDGV
jgi:hypothetical protein